MCKTCVAGQYTASASAVCRACETGKFQELTAAVQYQCKFCAAGKRFTAKTTACANCVGGKYQEQNSFASAVCKTCAAGQYTKSSIVICKVCELGKFQDLAKANAYTCKQCLVGFYSNEEETSICPNCPAGYIQSVAGQTSCFSCQAGKFETGTQVLCQNCATGRFNDLDHQTTCTICKSGTYIDVPGSTHCKSCPTGKWIDDDSITLSSHQALSACKTCPKGKIIPDPGGTHGEYTTILATRNPEDSISILITLGLSTKNQKTVTAPATSPSIAVTIVCPNVVSRSNWVSGGFSGDTFDITVNNQQINARRSDSTVAGWDVNLKFNCTAYPKYSAITTLLGCISGARKLGISFGSSLSSNVDPPYCFKSGSNIFFNSASSYSVLAQFFFAWPTLFAESMCCMHFGFARP